MVVIARPDLLYAVIGHLLTFSELTSLVNSVGGWLKKRDGTPSGSGPRISASLQGGKDAQGNPAGWAMPTSAIWLKKAGGPPGDYEVGIKTTRLDARCYGSTGYEAGGVWAMLDAILVPPDSSGVRRAASFTQGGVKIIDIRPEADAISDREPQTLYPVVWSSYIVVWSAAS